MRKTLFILIAALILTAIEFFLFNHFGRWFKPNFSIILIVFFNLYWGSWYGVVTAIVAGILKDSFSPGVFGLNIFAFIMCSYVTSLIRKYFYHIASSASRVHLVVIICVMNVLIHYVFNVLVNVINFGAVFRFILLPETMATTLAASYVFKNLKQCVSRFSV